jgi:transposase InsO family protein
VAENLLNRRFETDRPNKVWFSDITYIRTQEGGLYLSAVLDWYNREIIGWSVEERLTQDRVLQAFRQALLGRKSDPGVLCSIQIAAASMQHRLSGVSSGSISFHRA